MANRHQRRKRAERKKQDLLAGLAQAARSAEIQKIVRKNLASPPERNYYAKVQSSIALCINRGALTGGSGPTSSVSKEFARKR